MQIAAVQFDIAWEDKPANFSKVRSMLAAAGIADGSLIVLPEMFATGFSMNVAATRESEKREGESCLADIADAYRSWVVGGVVSQLANGRGRNEAVAFAPGGRPLARYAKIHPFSLGGEAERHEAGSEIVTFPCGGFLAAPFVCYDLRFPESFRVAARKGANLFVVIALWPVKRQQHWLTLLQARAIENQAFVIGVNRVGNEPQFTYAGRSVVVDPHGVIIADAGEQERVLHAAIDVETVNDWRRDFPALRDATWNDE